MIKVHHLENSRSQRVLWLLEELGLDYEVVRYERDKKTMLAPPELARVHPLGKSPVIEDGGAGRSPRPARSSNIWSRKAEGRLGPPANREAVLRYRHFLHYAEGSMMPPLLALLVVNRLGLLGKPAKKPLLAMFGKHLDWLESELAARDLVRRRRIHRRRHHDELPARGGAAARRPRRARGRNLIDWLERIHARPAYAEALKRGGPYAYA